MSESLSLKKWARERHLKMSQIKNYVFMSPQKMQYVYFFKMCLWCLCTHSYRASSYFIFSHPSDKTVMSCKNLSSIYLSIICQVLFFYISGANAPLDVHLKQFCLCCACCFKFRCCFLSLSCLQKKRKNRMPINLQMVSFFSVY